MICSKCHEPVKFGKPCVVEPAHETLKNWYFHPACHEIWVREMKEVDEQHVRLVLNAGFTH